MSAFGVAVGLGVGCAVLVVVGPGRGEATRVRNRVLAVPRAPGFVSEGLATDGSPTSSRVTVLAVNGLRAVGGWARRTLRRPPRATADLPAGVALVAGPIVMVVLGPVAGLMVAAAVIGSAWWWDRRAPRLRETEIRAGLPDVVDLFRLAVGAGLSVHQAIEVVAPRAPEPVGRSLQEVRRRVGLGVRLGDALAALDDLGDAAAPLQSALTAAARYGTPLTAALDRVVVDARMLRRRRAEEQARKLPVKLLFPLVMCVLPAFGLLAVVPLLAGSLPSLTPGP